eukprot:4085612-Heterocapsa_arctica.AAC.1
MQHDCAGGANRDTEAAAAELADPRRPGPVRTAAADEKDGRDDRPAAAELADPRRRGPVRTAAASGPC